MAKKLLFMIPTGGRKLEDVIADVHKAFDENIKETETEITFLPHYKRKEIKK